MMSAAEISSGAMMEEGPPTGPLFDGQVLSSMDVAGPLFDGDGFPLRPVQRPPAAQEGLVSPDVADPLFDGDGFPLRPVQRSPAAQEGLVSPDVAGPLFDGDGLPLRAARPRRDPPEVLSAPTAHTITSGPDSGGRQGDSVLDSQHDQQEPSMPPALVDVRKQFAGPMTIHRVGIMILIL